MSNKYHSTSQFRNVVKHIKQKTQYVGYDEVANKAVVDRAIKMPTLEYVGTVKLHGTNASIILHEDGEVSFHSKNQILGMFTSRESGQIIGKSDNAGFFHEMSSKKDAIYNLFLDAMILSRKLHGKVIYPIKISGEWCGQGVQKGVAVSFLPKKSLFIFGVKFGVEGGWCPVLETLNIQSNGDDIYNITQFPVSVLNIDFNAPKLSQNKLVEATLEVEDVCPVGKSMGILQSTLGEGLVWTPTDRDLVEDTGTWFKTKGKKHSVSKTKSVAPVDIEKINSVNEFVDYAITTNRLQQALQEVGLDEKLFGKFIGWVSKDVHKEELDTLEKNNLTMKDVGSKIASRARDFYLQELNKL